MADPEHTRSAPPAGTGPITGKYMRGAPSPGDEPAEAVSDAVPGAAPVLADAAADAIEVTGNLVVVTNTVALMLDFRRPGGHRRAFPYGYLSEIELDPPRGLVCSFPGTTVTVAGRNLEVIYQAILNHTAMAIIQSPSGFDPGTPEPFVETIEIATAEGAPA